MSRLLACAPEGLIGTRMHKDSPPEAAQVLQQYNERMLNIMETQYPLAPGHSETNSNRGRCPFQPKPKNCSGNLRMKLKRQWRPAVNTNPFAPLPRSSRNTPPAWPQLLRAIAISNHRTQPRRPCLRHSHRRLLRDRSKTDIRIQLGRSQTTEKLGNAEAARLAPDRLGQTHHHRARYLSSRPQRHPRPRNRLEPGQDPGRARLAHSHRNAPGDMHEWQISEDPDQ